MPTVTKPLKEAVADPTKVRSTMATARGLLKKERFNFLPMDIVNNSNKAWHGFSAPCCMYGYSNGTCVC